MIKPLRDTQDWKASFRVVAGLGLIAGLGATLLATAADDGGAKSAQRTAAPAPAPASESSADALALPASPP